MKNLTDIANKNKTDKGTIFYEAHGYTEVYQKYISSSEPSRLLEIGIWQGDSIRMWNEYNSNIDVHAVDISESFKNFLNGQEKFKYYIGDQSDKVFLQNVLQEIQNLDFVIDDGSHNHDDILNSFEFIYPKLNKGAVYFIEDLHAGHAERYKLISNLITLISVKNFEISQCEFVCNGKLLILKK